MPGERRQHPRQDEVVVRSPERLLPGVEVAREDVIRLRHETGSIPPRRPGPARAALTLAPPRGTTADDVIDPARTAPPPRDATALNLDVPVARPGEFRPLRVGALRVWPPVVLAPMAGVTNRPFRTLCREFGAGLYVSEMITARGFLEGNHLTRLLASGGADERPRSVQLYGTNPSDLEETARIMVSEGVEHLDLNFGCPVPKVTRNGGGSAIPVRPRLMARLVAATVRGAGDVPVTVKVRTGIHEELITCFDSGRVAEAEGAAAIGLHARTAAQLYAGEADWDAIAALKAAVSIPVLGNGDVWECWDALRMLRARPGATGSSSGAAVSGAHGSSPSSPRCSTAASPIPSRAWDRSRRSCAVMPRCSSSSSAR